MEIQNRLLGILLCLCLLSCGGKAQETEEKKTVEVPQPGAYGFPKGMNVKCEVVLKVTFNYSLDDVIWTRSSVYPWAHGREEYALYYYEDGQWKDITEETIAPELREAFRKILMGDSYLFAGAYGGFLSFRRSGLHDGNSALQLFRLFGKKGIV